MHQDIEKLLNAAKEKGSVTEKQREIILSKAQQLGEDMAELEFVLEDIPIKKGENDKLKSKRCPQCGAIVDDMALKCPDCGYAFKDESDANLAVRKIIEETERKIEEARNSDRDIIRDKLMKGREKDDEVWDYEIDDEVEKRVRAAVAAFKVPYTQNALIQAYEYAYGQFEQNKLTDTMIAPAWLGKSKELYGLIRSQPNKDVETKAWLEAHAEVLKASTFPKWAIAILIAFFIGIILIIIFAS